MNFVELKFDKSFSDLLSLCSYECVAKTIMLLEGRYFYLSFNDIKSEGLDKVSFLDFKSSKRVVMKIGRFVNKLFTETAIVSASTQHDLERFINTWKAFSTFDDVSKNFEIVKGEDIRKYYNEKNNLSGGTLENSCMRYASCQPFFDLYCNNPKKVSMIILKNDDGTKIKGRAIIWNNINMRMDSWDKSRKEKVNFMDRIYYTDDSIAQLFKIYALRNNFVFKARQDFESTGPFFVNGELHNNDVKFFFYLDNVIDDSFPFLDTLYYYSDKNGFISNRPFKDSIQLTNTDGTYHED